MYNENSVNALTTPLESILDVSGNGHWGRDGGTMVTSLHQCHKLAILHYLEWMVAFSTPSDYMSSENAKYTFMRII
jgi:hypothetical protein